MVDYKYGELFENDSIEKQLIINTDDGLVKITNEELHQEQFELSESLCSDSELRFGCCEASSIKFKISNVFIPLKGKWLTVKATLDGKTDAAFIFGRYKVYSDKPTADRKFRDVEAYDAMYDIINAEMSDWYNALLPEKTSTVTLKKFRSSFIQYFGLEEEEIELINDNMIVEKTIEPSEISGKDIITSICEINGCFGHIGRNGKFCYILLPKYIQGLYPAETLYPRDDLYPRDPKTTRIGKHLYISCKYEDFVTQGIDKLQVRQEENDIGAIVGTGNNCYIIEDNFLVYGKSAKDLEGIAKNVLNVISEITYRPFEAECKGNPCFEVGDAVRLPTKYEIIESYIFQRTLKGIQALKDAYSSEGVEEYSEKVNSINKSIIQLKGKTNILERDVEHTRSEIKDVEKGLKSEIVQTAYEIRSEVSDSVNGLSSQITQTATEIRAEVKDVNDGLSSKITQTSSEIRSEINDSVNELSSRITQNTESITTEVTRAQGAEGSLSSRINQTAESITAEVNRAQGAEGSLSSAININAQNISTKVSKDSVVSEINQSAEGIKIKAELLELLGNVYMTGGYINITSANPVGNILKFSRDGAYFQAGNDGCVSVADDGRKALVQYSEISVTNGDLKAMLTDDGVGISSYGWNSYSDKRLKHDIEKLDLDKSAHFIDSLSPVRFKYNYDSAGQYRHGLIAQEVLEEIGNEDWAICGENENENGEKYYTLNYLELIADIIATVQLQNKKIKELERKIEDMEEKLYE